MKRNLRKITLEPIEQMIKDLGFKKRGALFVMDIAPGVLGMLGLCQSTRYHGPGEVTISPNVGVTFVEVERMVCECAGRKFRVFDVMTICKHLQYLMNSGRYEFWEFGPEVPVEVAQDMVEAIRIYGVPFMRANADLGSLRQRIREDYGFEHQLCKRGPVAALLDGDAAEARRLVEHELAMRDGANYGEAEDFRAFADCFLKRIPEV